MENIRYSIIFAAIFFLFFTFSSPTHAESNQTYEVGTDVLNVRDAPHKDAEVVGKLKFGDSVPAFKERNGWVSTFYGGKEVWVASHFLVKSENNEAASSSTTVASTNEAVQSVAIQADSVRLRSGPGTENSIIGHASKGDTYPLVETNEDWLKVKLDNGNTVWVASWLTNQATSNSPSEQPAEQTSTPNASQPLAGYNIILDPGHGGVDPGSLSLNNEKEKVLALDVSNVIAEKLRSEGATVLLTRSKDSYVSLQERVRISESYLTDAFISVHFNAFTSQASNGVSTHYFADGAERELAQHIQTALNKHTNLTNRGVKQDNYYVLRENNDLSILVELGFITNPHDLEVIRDPHYSSQIADAIFEGLVKYFNE